jgi:MFS family permease
MSRGEWALLVLLVASVLINYIDRGVLPVSAPLIQRQLDLSPLEIGALLAAFSWTYALAQLAGISGWFADRFPVRLVLAGGFVIWSAATVVTGVLSTFAAMYVARLVLGLGESIAYPCYSRLFIAYLPNQHLGRANALLDAGSKLGPALSSLLGGFFLVAFGWRVFFIFLGLISFIWLVPWLAWKPPGGAGASIVRNAHALSLRQLLRVRSAWGTFGGHFCGNYFWFFLLTWLPTYLVQERNFSIGRMAGLTTAVYLVTASSTVCTGWISDWLIARGHSRTRVRKTIVICGLMLSSVIMPVAFVQNVWLSLVFLFAASIAFGAYASNHWAITQTLAGPMMAGRWTSVQNGVGNISGILAPTLAGASVQFTGSSRYAFVLSAAIVFLGAIFWKFVVGPVEQVSWETEAIMSKPHRAV